MLSSFAHLRTEWPWVELALAEAKVDYTRVEIDLTNKPEWYASKVNINPARTFVADLYPDSTSSQRTPAALLHHTVSTKVVPAPCKPVSRSSLFRTLQDLLPVDTAPRTAADTVIAAVLPSTRIFSGARFKRLVKYFAAIEVRESVNATFDGEYNKEMYPERFASLRKQAQAAAVAAVA
ncbi:hypothetical protein C8R44DRAFT_885389 [Mycena epipterygia]|nr:hypothetical protein C8R44DRAFT_885389 [Mycena epipterygia]